MVNLSPTRTIIRGDSDKFQITFSKKVKVGSREQITPINITDWNIRFTVRPDTPSSSTTTDTDAVISEQATITDASKGKAMIYVSSAVTTLISPGTYYYDIQVIKPIDSYGHKDVSSIRKGKYIVLGDITRLETTNNTNNSTNNTTDDSIDDSTDDADNGYTI